MNVQHLIRHFGSQANAALALNTSRQTISYWKAKGIPVGRQFQIQVLTGGILKADPAHQTSQKPEAA
jgi:hypothetical protein